LKIKRTPEVITPPIAQESDGTVHLLASNADLHGGSQYQTSAGTGNIGYWTNPKDTADWTFKPERPENSIVRRDCGGELGQIQVTVKPVAAGWQPMNLHSLTLQLGDESRDAALISA